MSKVYWMDVEGRDEIGENLETAVTTTTEEPAGLKRTTTKWPDTTGSDGVDGTGMTTTTTTPPLIHLEFGEDGKTRRKKRAVGLEQLDVEFGHFVGNLTKEEQQEYAEQV